MRHLLTKIVLFLCALSAALLLGSCAAREAGGALPAADTPAQTATPAAQTAAPAEETPASAAEAAEPLRLHTPCLFPDGDGFLDPDGPLTDEALTLALEALQPSAEAEAALRALAGGTRRDFARAVAALAGWTAEERLIPAEGALAPVDLDPADADHALLLELSVPHTEDAGGLTWAEAALPGAHEPGVFLRGCELYCAGEDGFLLRGESVGPLAFGADGRFTSGDAELDAMVSEVVAALQERYPEDATDRLAMLRHCYDYAYENFSYLGRRHAEPDGVDWSAEEAKTMFSTGKGSCYHYAAAFRAMARRLGFPAYTILRSLDGDPANIHAWTDIEIEGVAYIFDPQLHQRYGNERFMLTYKEAQQLGGYTRPTRPGEFR